MAMTNDNMAATALPKALTPEQIKAAAAAVTATAKTEEDELLAGIKGNFDNTVAAEARAQAFTEQDNLQQVVSGKNISELTEDDAYNLEIGIAAQRNASPDFLKITLKNKNYVARWGNRDSIRMSQLVAKGFTYVRLDECENSESLAMFGTEEDTLVWADLVAMKVPKDVYYAGLRAAYVKSLYATNNRKASEAGSKFAASNLNSTLNGSERSYMAQHQQQSDKPIYNPQVGV